MSGVRDATTSKIELQSEDTLQYGRTPLLFPPASSRGEKNYKLRTSCSTLYFEVSVRIATVGRRSFGLVS